MGRTNVLHRQEQIAAGLPQFRKELEDVSKDSMVRA